MALPDDPGTDPGRPHPYESLYRSPAGEPIVTSRPTPRHYVPSISPPDGASEGYGWLYRPDEPVPELVELVPDPAARPPVAAPPLAERRPGISRALVLAVVALLVVACAGIAAGVGLSRRPAPVSGGGRPVASVPAAPDSAAPTDPAAAPPPVPSTAVATCQAPAATDDAGRRVSYPPASLVDGDKDTAWRCAGSSVGQSVEFTFPAPTTVTRVALINGYAKIDPTSGAHRYLEYRRVTQVTWTFSSGAAFTQTLADRNEAPQSMGIGPQQTSRVTLTVDAVTGPGSKLATRDAVLISEASFG